MQNYQDAKIGKIFKFCAGKHDFYTDKNMQMIKDYEKIAMAEMALWQDKVQRHPSLFSRMSAKVQARINRIIPQKVHKAITVTIKQMVRAVLTGAKIVTQQPKEDLTLEQREILVKERIEFYKKAAAAEGGITGAGGLLAGLADFPLLLAIKLKLLFEIASLYGYSVNNFKERLYILHIFQLAFSSQRRKAEVYSQMVDWEKKSADLPDDIHQFDWQTFQQEYRDYLDLAKMAQLIPVIGAPVGFIVNYRLINLLGITAMNAYRLRMRKQLLNNAF